MDSEIETLSQDARPSKRKEAFVFVFACVVMSSTAWTPPSFPTKTTAERRRKGRTKKKKIGQA